MIQPTVGRVVWYHPGNADSSHPAGTPLSAQIAAVNQDGTVNLGVLDSKGNQYARQNVKLLQPESPDPVPTDEFASWMPYQVGQSSSSTDVVNRVSALEQANLPTRVQALEQELTGIGSALGRASQQAAPVAGQQAAAPAEQIPPPVDNAHVAQGATQFAPNGSS